MHWEDKMKKSLPGEKTCPVCGSKMPILLVHLLGTVYCPAVALSFSLVLVPLSLPWPIFLSLLELNHTEAGSCHPACISSLGFSLCWPGQPAGCPRLFSPFLQDAWNCHRSQWDSHSTSTFLPFLWVYVLEAINTSGLSQKNKAKQNRKNSFFDSLKKAD